MFCLFYCVAYQKTFPIHCIFTVTIHYFFCPQPPSPQSESISAISVNFRPHNQTLFSGTSINHPEGVRYE